MRFSRIRTPPSACAVSTMANSVTIPKPGWLYWICQAAGWTAFATYVLVFYFIYARPYHASEITSIVVFCTAVPVLMTHGLRAWMYIHRWQELKESRRKVRQFASAVVLALAVTAAVGVANDLPRGRLFIPIDGMGWMLLAYWWAFGIWIWFYEMAHVRRRRSALERVAREAQLRALRGQLNPHFLFNSLNSVRSLISENPQRAASMVTGLSEILRYSLTSDRRETVALAEELAVIDEYVDVERIRFEERLRVAKVIDPALLTARVPPMLVQTLVENAVKHGVAPRAGGGDIRLEAGVRDGHIEIVVSNSGPFVPASNDEGFGLQGAVERLRLMYGTLASLVVRGDGDRTVATLVLPLDPVAQ